jgi:hypothetical protein
MNIFIKIVSEAMSHDRTKLSMGPHGVMCFCWLDLLLIECPLENVAFLTYRYFTRREEEVGNPPKIFAVEAYLTDQGDPCGNASALYSRGEYPARISAGTPDS